jgi:hypothetical protein
MVLEAGMSKTKDSASDEGLLAVSSHGRRAKREGRREMEGGDKEKGREERETESERLKTAGLR